MFLNKVIAVESVPIHDISLVITYLNESSQDLNTSTISEYELFSKRKIVDALLKKYTLQSAHPFIWFVENLQSLSNEQKVGLLRFDKEKAPKEKFATFLQQFYVPFIKDPVVCQKLLCLYQELKPIGSDSVSPKLDTEFSEVKKRILALNVDNSVAKQFVEFVLILDIKQPVVGKNPKAVLLESFEAQDQVKFEKLLKFYKKILPSDVSVKLLEMMHDSPVVSEFDPNEILGTSTPPGTLARSQDILPSPDTILPLSGVTILKGEIRKMFASSNKVVERQAILEKLKKNPNGQVIRDHLLKNNWRLFLGHSKFKKDLKSLCIQPLDFPVKQNLFDNSAMQY